MIKLKRVYEEASKDDGARVLVDRLWPRGISKEKAQLALWLKNIAPSDALRKWFGHDPHKWNEFKKRYKQELQNKKEYIQQIKELEKKEKKVTLIFGAKDTKHNNATVLSEFLT